MYDSRFGTRGSGAGPYAESIAQLFTRTAERLGFETYRDRDAPQLREGSWGDEPVATFERPSVQNKGKAQLALF
jgi:hypothetical protein